MIEAPVTTRGPFAFWCDPGSGRFQGDLPAGNLKATRRQARRVARTPQRVDVLGSYSSEVINTPLTEFPRSIRDLILRAKFLKPLDSSVISKSA